MLARVKDRPREGLARTGLTNPDGGGIALYWSVDDAAHAAATAGE